MFTKVLNENNPPALCEDLDIIKQRLIDAMEDLKDPTSFEVGDFVSPKDAYGIYRLPEGTVAIVTETFEPIEIAELSKSAGHLARADTVILFSENNVWMFYPVDSRYFKKID